MKASVINFRDRVAIFPDEYTFNCKDVSKQISSSFIQLSIQKQNIVVLVRTKINQHGYQFVLRNVTCA
jgi:hypothetical protein